MAYLVLARKYRPQRFADVVGQDHVTRTMMNALAQERIAHGYIFSGHRGIGKTTIARILAMALNCRMAIGSKERPSPEPCGVCDSCTEVRSGGAVDVIEIDAATNRGIDEIRELREAARYAPARDRYKIYILDEAHQITDAAFNALLKTLEEPPDHVIFMMATTQPEDIPQTIRSRCQHFSFHAVRFDDILAQLRSIAAAEQITAEDAALALLAEAGDGSMRDALSIMDQAIASAPIEEGRARLDADQIRELMGTVPNTVFERLLEAVNENQSSTVIEEINRLLNAGHNPSQLARQFVRYLRNCLMAKLGGEATELIQLSPDERARSARSAALYSEEDLTRFLQMMLRTFDELNYRQEQRFHLELGLLKLVHLQRLLPIEELLSQLPAPRPAGPVKTPASLPSGSRSPATPALQQPAHADRQPTAETGRTPSGFSPFQADQNRRSGRETMQADTPVEPTVHVVSGPLASPLATGLVLSQAAEEESSIALLEPPLANHPLTPETANTQPEALTVAPGEGCVDNPAAPNLDEIRDSVATALDDAGHHTAAALLIAGEWSASAGAVQAAVAIKKMMLGLTMNLEAEKIARNAMRAKGWNQKLFVITSDEAGIAGETKPAVLPKPVTGTAHGRALKHPLVQQAQELFQAEVRSVMDLSRDTSD